MGIPTSRLRSGFHLHVIKRTRYPPLHLVTSQSYTEDTLKIVPLATCRCIRCETCVHMANIDTCRQVRTHPDISNTPLRTPETTVLDVQLDTLLLDCIRARAHRLVLLLDVVVLLVVSRHLHAEIPVAVLSPKEQRKRYKPSS